MVETPSGVLRNNTGGYKVNIRNTDFFILSSFGTEVRSIPDIHKRTIPAGIALVEVANRYIQRLTEVGHDRETALFLLNDVVNDIHREEREWQDFQDQQEDQYEERVSASYQARGQSNLY